MKSKAWWFVVVLLCPACFSTRGILTPGLSSPGAKWKKVTVGVAHACGLREDGRVQCWGESATGKTEAPAGTFSDIDAGPLCTCGVTADSKAVCWGRCQKPPAESFRRVATGKEFSCGLTRGNEVVCWGALAFRARVAGKTLRSIQVSSEHVCVLATDGTPYCVGRFAPGCFSAPPGRLRQVALGASMSDGDVAACGIQMDGQLLCWGMDKWDEAKPAAPQSADPTGSFDPGKALDLDFLAQVGDKLQEVRTSARYERGRGIFSLALIAAAALRSIFPPFPRFKRMALQGGIMKPPAGKFRRLSMSWNNACAIDTDGKVVCWPHGPGEPVSPPGRFVQVDTTTTLSCGVRDDGRIACWGWDWSGTATPP